MSNMLQAYKRTGSFIIDMTIVQMFSTLVIRLVFTAISYFSLQSNTAFSLNGDIALPLLLGLVLLCFGIVIGVYMTYHWVCYRFLKTSLSRYFLRLTVVSTNDEEVSKSRYLNRELKKIYFSVMTMGLYPLYHGAQLLAHGHVPWHDKHFETEVIHY